MKRQISQGATSETVNVYIQDLANSGAGLAGLAFNTSGLQAYYCRPRGTPTQITLATLAAVTSAWSSGGFKELDATNMKGWYRFDLPNAALAAGAESVEFLLTGASGMLDCPMEIELSTNELIAVEVAQAVTANTLTLLNGTRALAGMYVWLGDQQTQISSIDATAPTAKIATLDPPITSPGGTPTYSLLRGSGAPTTALPSVDLGTIAGEDVEFNESTQRWGPNG